MSGRDFSTSERTALDRFFRRVEVTPTCWLWHGERTHNGYGRFYQDETQSSVAHRWLYVRLVGPVPEGLQLDHLCRVRECVNVDHLEPVTPLENTRRGEGGAHMRRKTECPAGHPYDLANTKINIRRDGSRQRACRACGRQRARLVRARRKVLA